MHLLLVAHQTMMVRHVDIATIVHTIAATATVIVGVVGGVVVVVVVGGGGGGVVGVFALVIVGRHRRSCWMIHETLNFLILCFLSLFFTHLGGRIFHVWFDAIVATRIILVAFVRVIDIVEFMVVFVVKLGNGHHSIVFPLRLLIRVNVGHGKVVDASTILVQVIEIVFQKRVKRAKCVVELSDSRHRCRVFIVLNNANNFVRNRLHDGGTLRTKFLLNEPNHELVGCDTLSGRRSVRVHHFRVEH
mmetsp:Transcript_53131/g.88054  ORF Transcript_53131/g.88054 Transcript_53131/m.88054 type:complete len:246 (-) Transcript_53131:1051-1788(-)